MSRLRRALVAVALAAATTPAFGLTLLQLDRVPTVQSAPIQRVVSSADGAFTVSAIVSPQLVNGVLVRSVTRVDVFVQVTCQRPDCHVGGWHFRFGNFIPFDPPLLSGAAYVGSGTVGPLEALYDSTSGYCPLGDSQTLLVREVTTDANGQLLHFAADFARECRGGSDSYAGIIRWHAGDTACVGQPDGTPCDDLHPCTQSDACHGSECLSPFDPSPCSPLTCDDANPCTDDALNGMTCSHEPIAGSCWDVAVKTTLVVNALGRSCGCRLPASTSRLALTDDGHFRIPGGEADATLCTTGHPTVYPDEVGTWRARRRARVLETPNLADVLLATENCTGGLGIAIRHYGTRVRLSVDGNTLTGQQVLSGRLQGAPATARIVSRLTAVPGSGAGTSSTIGLDRINAAARRCGRRIAACLRQ